MGYPTGVFNPSARSNGQSIDASHINDLQNELNAIETALLGTITHSLNVSGASTLASLHVSGGSTFAGGVNFGGASTLGTVEAGASTLASLVVSGGSTLAGLQAVDSTVARLTVSSAAPADPLANTIYGGNICHAHAVISSTPGIVAAFNISSAGSPAAGRASLAFGTPMASSDYTPIVTPNHPTVGALLFFGVTAKASTGFEVYISSQSGAVGLCPFGVSVMGRG